MVDDIVIGRISPVHYDSSLAFHSLLNHSSFTISCVSTVGVRARRVPGGRGTSGRELAILGTGTGFGQSVSSRFVRPVCQTSVVTVSYCVLSHVHLGFAESMSHVRSPAESCRMICGEVSCRMQHSVISEAQKSSHKKRVGVRSRRLSGGRGTWSGAAYWERSDFRTVMSDHSWRIYERKY